MIPTTLKEQTGPLPRSSCHPTEIALLKTDRVCRARRETEIELGHSQTRCHKLPVHVEGARFRPTLGMRLDPKSKRIKCYRDKAEEWGR
ncbi:hypothetical protein chiPu_0018879 [Chiloscyllium punctatum]|uniref:Uncharacterized protein n=1 Tax=Chiloscyllium punctatum TaxID=137246 RepID=A0A401RQ51_CHIPU|nr:hypothetical protein [Chiloscyllium punctatum]